MASGSADDALIIFSVAVDEYLQAATQLEGFVKSGRDGVADARRLISFRPCAPPLDSELIPAEIEPTARIVITATGAPSLTTSPPPPVCRLAQAAAESEAATRASDPVLWFGSDPPAPLREAQDAFRSALPLVCAMVGALRAAESAARTVAERRRAREG